MPAHGDHAPRALWPRSSRHGPPAWADMLATVAMGHSAARLNSNIFQIPIGLFKSNLNSILKLVQIHLNFVQTVKFDQIDSNL
jgi:hypothetical protein